MLDTKELIQSLEVFITKNLFEKRRIINSLREQLKLEEKEKDICFMCGKKW